jgi:C1A family cysteine protease
MSLTPGREEDVYMSDQQKKKSGSKFWPFDDAKQRKLLGGHFFGQPDNFGEPEEFEHPKSFGDRFSALRPRRSGIGKEGSASRKTVSLGYLPDLPDLRDRNFSEFINPEEKSKKASSPEQFVKFREKLLALKQKGLPTQVNNIQWCTPVENQGELGSCTAQAVVSMMEYMQLRGNGKYVEGSRLFVYKTTRNLLGWIGDTGGSLRAAMKSLALFGIPPEEYWPYVIERFDEEPSSFLYSFAANYQALDYTRLDSYGLKQAIIIENIKNVLAAGLPVVFGFSVYTSISNAPDIPFPNPTMDKQIGGHAVMAVGYDIERVVNGKPTPSLIIRNSWGPEWGVYGYGYLPFDYINFGLAQDFWTVFKLEWLDLAKFD